MLPNTVPTAIPVRAPYVVARMARLLAEREAEVRRLLRELDAIAELAEEELGEWIAVAPPFVPERLAALHSIYRMAAAQMPAPAAAPDNETCPGQLQGAAANGRSETS